MGYYTEYSLMTSLPTENNKTLLKKIIKLARKNDESIAFAIDDNGDPQQRCKWYEHENDMRAISALHPGVLFTLSGDGEEQGDSWKKYFRDGNMQVAHAVIAFDEFDPTKLA